MFSKKRQLILLTFALVSASSCGDSNNNDSAQVRFVHGATGTQAVDIFVNNDLVLEDVGFRDSSGYLEVDEGAANIKVNVAESTTSLVDTTVSIAKDENYTVVASGVVGSVEPIVLVDDVQPEDDSVQLRVVHSAASAPAVDVYVTAPDQDITSVTPLLTGVAFRASSDYLTVLPGSYQVRITPTGTKTVVIDTGAVSLDAGENYTAFALDGKDESTSFSSLLLKDTN
jgi:hypothetical protein